MYRNILLAVDTSPSSRLALEHATAIAQAFHAKLTIFSVVPAVPAFAVVAGVAPQALEDQAEAQTAGLLRDAAASAPDGLPVTTLLGRGQPGTAIVEQLAEDAYDLLVIGSRGHGRVSSTLLGSVGASVHFNATTPLLIIQAPEDDD